jgi:ATP-dependent helicase/nuclease subunit A
MTLLQTPEDVHALEEEDQQPIFDRYHADDGGRVVVSAGAGTGKTTTLIDIVAEAVLQELEHGEGNPMDKLLLTTFTNDAAGELKTKLKQRLRQHERAADETLDPELWRWIETGSYIETIDSFTQRLLREIAIDLGMSPGFEIRSGLDEEDLYDEIFEELQDDPNLDEPFQRLEENYPDLSWQDFPPATLREMLIQAHTKSREFCWTPDEAAEHLVDSVVETMHNGYEPPLTEDAVEDIVLSLTNRQRINPSEELVDHATRVYEHNLQLADDFGTILKQFDEVYDEFTIEEGLLSHTDVTYHVWRYIDSNPDSPWVESLSQRFNHVFIDEFQDTNFAQCQIIRRTVTNTAPATDLLLIGDYKQSIYQWRSAEPRIFAEIIEHAIEDSASDDPYLGATDLEYLPLTSNFRSHPDLVDISNHVFDSIFSDEARGNISEFDVPFEPLTAQRVHEGERNDGRAHFHIVDMGDITAKGEWHNFEAPRIAETVSGILEHGELEIVDQDNSDPYTDPSYTTPDPGDITLLFNRRWVMPQYAQALQDFGINCAIDSSEGLFREPEVELVIDVLNWFANPHSKDSLVRILRSPVSAVSDETLRFIASNQFYLTRALRQWDDDLPEDDRARIQGLVDLRDDLRWEREGPKAPLIHDIIRHTALDAIVLSDVDGRKCYGNLWLLAEVVNEWEEDDEMLSYAQFIVRLDRLRTRARRGDGDYEIAQTADEEADDTVRLTTVHQSKGMEYPIVILPDLCYRDDVNPYAERLVLDRQGIALHPTLGDQNSVGCTAGSGENWISDQGSGPQWISGNIDDDGLRHPNPLNRHFANEMAEYWRTLYVAMTRAEDHIIAGISRDEPYRGEYTTHTVALRNLMAPNGGWREGIHEKELTWDDLEGSTNVPIQIDNIEPGSFTAEDSIGIETAEASADESYIEDVSDTVPQFRPQVINPTSLHDLAECPRRFQYRMLQDVSTIRSDIPPGSEPPNGLQPDVWGTMVHDMMEEYAKSMEDIEDYLANEYSGDTLAELHGILDNIDQFGLPTLIDDSIETLPEFELTAYHEPTGTYVRGTIDLLVKNDDGWHVIDYKTGRVPDDEYMASTYRYQVNAYTWLLEQTYGVTPESTKLLYLHPNLKSTVVTSDANVFEEELGQLNQSMDLVQNEGLETRPDPSPAETSNPDLTTRCGTCAYRDLCPEWGG